MGGRSGRLPFRIGQLIESKAWFEGDMEALERKLRRLLNPGEGDVALMATAPQPLDLAVLVKLIQYGVARYQRGLRDQKAWAQAVEQALGPGVRPHLDTLFGLVRTQWEAAPWERWEPDHVHRRPGR